MTQRASQNLWRYRAVVQTTAARRLRNRQARRGGVYVVVLGVAIIASLAGIAALQVERANVRVAAGRELATEAQLAANSAVEFALAMMRLDPNWRNSYDHGVEYPTSSWIYYGQQSRFKVELLDVIDSNLSNNLNDAVTIRGVGSSGDAICVTTVSVEPGTRGLSCLDSSLHSGGRLSVDGNSTLDTNQWVSSNHSIRVQALLGGLFGLLKVAGSWIDGDAWSTGSISNDAVKGGFTQLSNQSPVREMPNPATLFDYYLSVGTRISYNSLSGREVRGILSPTSNPYGVPNPQGIYVVDCGGESVRIKDAQIRGTLVLLDSSDLRTEGTLDCQAAAPNYPALLLRGNLRMDHSGTISGLVYVTGNLSFTRSSTINGIVVVGGTATITSNLNVTYNSAARDAPPPGFGAGPDMRVVPGTWRRTVRN